MRSRTIYKVILVNDKDNTFLFIDEKNGEINKSKEIFTLIIADI